MYIQEIKTVSDAIEVIAASSNLVSIEGAINMLSNQEDRVKAFNTIPERFHRCNMYGEIKKWVFESSAGLKKRSHFY